MTILGKMPYIVPDIILLTISRFLSSWRRAESNHSEPWPWIDGHTRYDYAVKALGHRTLDALTLAALGSLLGIRYLFHHHFPASSREDEIN